MISPQHTTGIVLAGGKSTRMGKDKGLIPFRGKKLVEHAITFLACWCDTILVSANQHGYEQFGYPVIYDNFPDTGPMGGVQACLEASETKSNLIIACDIVDIPSSIPRLLLSPPPNYYAVVPVHPDGKAEPLCAWYHKNLYQPLRNSLEKKSYKMIDFLRKEKTFFLPLQEVVNNYHPGILPNLNHPDDLTATR